MPRKPIDSPDKWRFPKTHLFYHVAYCYRRGSKVYFFINPIENVPKRLRLATSIPFTIKNKPYALTALEAKVKEVMESKPKSFYFSALFEVYKQARYQFLTKSHKWKINLSVKNLVKQDFLLDSAELKLHIIENIKHLQKYNQNYIRKLLQCVGGIFSFGKQSNLCKINPIEGLLPKTIKNKVIAFSASEIEQFLEYFKTNNIEMYYIVKIISIIGLRISELLSIHKEDITETSIEIKGKGSKPRSIPLKPFPDLIAILNELKGRDKLIKYKHTQTPEKLLKQARIKLGIEKEISLHAIRKFRENELMKNGYPLKAIAELFGHSLATQEKYYNEVLGSDNLSKVFEIVPK